MKIFKKINKKAGFTLIELLLAVFFALIVLGGLLSVINYGLELQETSRNLIIATNAARAKIEEMHNAPFANLESYNNTTFTPAGLNGIGLITVTEVANSGEQLVDVRVVICWRQRGGRIIGEDNGSGVGGIALDGILNPGEDANGNGFIDSPCALTTAIRQT